MDERKAPKKPVKEEWTPEMIAKARKVYRAHGSAAEAVEAMGSQLSLGAARERLRKLGMRFTSSTGSIHNGTSVRVQGYEL